MDALSDTAMAISTLCNGSSRIGLLHSAFPLGNEFGLALYCLTPAGSSLETIDSDVLFCVIAFVTFIS